MFSPFKGIINYYEAVSPIDELGVPYQGKVIEFWEVPIGYEPESQEILDRFPINKKIGCYTAFYCYN